MSNFSLDTQYGINDQLKIDIDLSNNNPTTGQTVDLVVKFGSDEEVIYNQTGVGTTPNIIILHTVTSLNKSYPVVKLEFSNTSAGAYGWGTRIRIFKKVEEVFFQPQTGRKATITFNNDINRWTSRYSFLPEFMATHEQGIMTFLNGHLYIHDDSLNKNYFYGIVYPTYVSYVENEFPSQTKVFLTHSVEGKGKPSYATFECADDYQMFTDLVNDDYVKREAVHYSEIMGDTNDPNVAENAVYGDKLRNGTKLRGQYVKVGVTFRENDLEVKHSNIGFIASKGHGT